MRLSRNRRRLNADEIDDPLVLLDSNLHGDPLAGFLCGRKLEELLLQEIWSKLEVLVLQSKRQIILVSIR